MHFVSNKGCVANIAPSCPGGTKLENGKCVAILDTSCPAGMHFVTGTGCVQSAASAKKRADVLRATCSGLRFEVTGEPHLTGVRAQLLIDGARLASEELVDLGAIHHIEGTVKGKRVDLKVQQAAGGPRYSLNVDGVECQLSR